MLGRKIEILKIATDGIFDLIFKDDKTREKIALVQDLIKRLNEVNYANSDFSSAVENLESRINDGLLNYFDFVSYFNAVEEFSDTKVSYTIIFIHSYTEAFFWAIYFFYSNEIGKLEKQVGLPDRSKDYLKNSSAIDLYNKVNNDGKAKHNYEWNT